MNKAKEHTAKGVTYLVDSGVNDRDTICDNSRKKGNNLEDKFQYIEPWSFGTSTVGH